MIIILKKDANKQKVKSLKTELVNQGFKLHRGNRSFPDRTDR